MRLSLAVPVKCPESMSPHVQKVLLGEYDIPLPLRRLHRYTILDLGANVGAFAVWAAHRWPGSVIHCYEPSHENFALLQENTAEIPYVGCSNWGLGTPGIRPLYRGQNNCGEASLFGFGVGYHVEIKDPLTLPAADILKIDTEGAELEILRPLMKSERCFRAVMLEYHTTEARREIDTLLTDYVLTGAEVSSLNHGVVKYIHKGLT